MHIVPEAGVAASELRLVKGSHRQGARHRPGERLPGVGGWPLIGRRTQITAFTNFRSMACRISVQGQVCPTMRTPEEAGDVSCLPDFSQC